MSIRRWCALGLACLLLGGGFLGRAAILRAIGPGTSPVALEESGPESEPALRTIREAGYAIRPLHARKTPAQLGDWLDRQFEVGQTFHTYRNEVPNRPTGQLTTLYLQPLGSLTTKQVRLLDATADLLGRWYGVPVKMLDTIELSGIPEGARRISPAHRGEQVTTGYLLGILKERRPDDAVAVLGLTTVDLWPGKEGWSYVLGQASYLERVGVWSLYRMGDLETEYQICLIRTLKTAVHETGHMFTLRHCVVFECGMNGSNHQGESDARPMWFCPEDEMKVWWATGCDPATRYDRLADYADGHGLDAEARFWRASRALITKELQTLLSSPGQGSSSGPARSGKAPWP